MVTEPRSLEERADKCTHKPASVRVDSWRAHLLCRDCAHAYARQQAEAMRERACIVANDWPRPVNNCLAALKVGQQTGDWADPLVFMADKIAAAIQALPV